MKGVMVTNIDGNGVIFRRDKTESLRSTITFCGPEESRPPPSGKLEICAAPSRRNTQTEAAASK